MSTEGPSSGPAPTSTRPSFADKVNQIVGKMGSSSTPAPAPVSTQKDSNFTFYAGLAIIPVIGFGLCYLLFKPKEGEPRNYKKILMWSMIFSLIMIPAIYMAKINGYLPF
jgi:hypothetical protein